jgi:hypothetical protein
VRFLGYQPREVLSQSLSAADVHVVGLAEGLAGYVVPSRLYGILSAGRPVIVAADADSETARVVERSAAASSCRRAGRSCSPATIRRGPRRRARPGEMGRRGREYVVQEADRTVAFARYRSLVA